MSTYRHKKRGTEYVLIGFGKMQAENWRDIAARDCGSIHGPPVDMREVAIYRSVDDGSLWVRPREEFEDGRFETVLGENDCPVCAVAFMPDDMCLTDIELGICHAACLVGSPMVDLDTGEPLPEGAPGPIPFRYAEPQADLLAALKDMVELFEGIDGGEHDDAPALAAARAAIDATEGGAA